MLSVVVGHGDVHEDTSLLICQSGDPDLDISTEAAEVLAESREAKEEGIALGAVALLG